MVNIPDSRAEEQEIVIIERNLDRIQWETLTSSNNITRSNAPPRANVAGRTVMDRIDWTSLSTRFFSDEIAELAAQIDWTSLSVPNSNLRAEESPEEESLVEEFPGEESSEEESSEEEPVYRVI